MDTVKLMLKKIVFLLNRFMSISLPWSEFWIRDKEVYSLIQKFRVSQKIDFSLRSKRQGFIQGL